MIAEGESLATARMPEARAPKTESLMDRYAAQLNPTAGKAEQRHTGMGSARVSRRFLFSAVYRSFKPDNGIREFHTAELQIACHSRLAFRFSMVIFTLDILFAVADIIRSD